MKRELTAHTNKSPRLAPTTPGPRPLRPRATPAKPRAFYLHVRLLVPRAPCALCTRLGRRAALSTCTALARGPAPLCRATPPSVCLRSARPACPCPAASALRYCTTHDPRALLDKSAPNRLRSFSAPPATPRYQHATTTTATRCLRRVLSPPRAAFATRRFRRALVSPRVAFAACCLHRVLPSPRPDFATLPPRAHARARFHRDYNAQVAEHVARYTRACCEW